MLENLGEFISPMATIVAALCLIVVLVWIFRKGL